MQRERVAVAGRAPLLVDHLDREARLGERQRGDEAGRARADDEHVGLMATGTGYLPARDGA